MQDNWEALCNQARYFTFSKYLKMKSDAQSRLLWLIAKLVALQARGVDGLCMGLIRQIKGTKAEQRPACGVLTFFVFRRNSQK